MFKNYYKKVEDKYVFNISTFFWHFLILLLTIGMLIGLFMALYGVIPATRRNVAQPSYPVKPSYPQAAKVTIDDLINKPSKQNQPISQQVYQNISTQSQPSEEVVDPGYQLSLDKLKTLIPPSKYPWQKEEISYPNGKEVYDSYHNPSDIRITPVGPGLLDYLNTAYNNSHVRNYGDKKRILDAFIDLLSKIKESERQGVLYQIVYYPINNIDTSIVKLHQLKKVLMVFRPNELENVSGEIVPFGRNNPADGRILIDYLTINLTKFDTSQRLKSLYNIVNAYYNYFNNTVNSQIEATNSFLSLLPQIPDNQQANMLTEYYEIFNQKNKSRQDSIQKIEMNYKEATQKINAEYQNQLSNAEGEYESSKYHKQDLIKKGGIGIAAGIILISFVGVILTLFSMQRILRRMEERIDKQGSGT